MRKTIGELAEADAERLAPLIKEKHEGKLPSALLLMTEFHLPLNRSYVVIELLHDKHGLKTEHEIWWEKWNKAQAAEKALRAPAVQPQQPAKKRGLDVSGITAFTD